MGVRQQIRKLYNKVTFDSVRCGTLAIFVFALGLFIGMMQFFSNHQLLESG